jgi:thioredoxin-related protein
MKNLIYSALLSLAVFTSSAGDQWLTDFGKAKEQAKKENKAVLMDFTGSDWCPPCMQLKKKVFDTKQFKEFAEKSLVLVEVDFPNKKLPATQAKANEELKKQFSIEGFPTIVVLDSQGNKLSQDVGYSGESPSEYIKKLEGVLAKAKRS